MERLLLRLGPEGAFVFAWLAFLFTFGQVRVRYTFVGQVSGRELKVGPRLRSETRDPEVNP